MYFVLKCKNCSRGLVVRAREFESEVLGLDSLMSSSGNIGFD